MLFSWVGGASVDGVSIPDTPMIGSPATQAAGDTLYLQNDSNTAPSSPWYVNQIDQAHYEMPNATAPKGARYLGAFLIDGVTGEKQRASGASWTTSDPDVVQISQVTESGQAVVNILAAGKVTLTATLGDLVSTLAITAIEGEFFMGVV